jgi:hypothetical protein
MGMDILATLLIDAATVSRLGSLIVIGYFLSINFYIDG